jgi:hypothetical protein
MMFWTREVAMKALRQSLIAFLSGAALASGAVLAASTTDFSDQWWTPTESGWGASIHQQSDKLFIDLMVYGADGKPAWFSVAAALQSGAPAGHTVFSGDLYATTGPYYGSAFNPSSVAMRKAGTLTFDATGANNATVSYNLDGAPVVKNVTRQTWSGENLSGRYDAIWKYSCSGAAAFPFEWGFTVTVIRHNADNTVSINVTRPFMLDAVQHDFRGDYTQSGHLGQVNAGLVAPDSGSITISEIAKTLTGFTGRLSGRMSTGYEWQSGVVVSPPCQITDGRIVAVRAP